MALLVRRAFRHLSRVHDVLFRRTLLEREITIFDDDVFLTSYPRSGNTWTRFLVGNFVNPNEPVTFLNVERLVPDMYKTADWVLRRRPRPRVLKSHESFDARYRRVIYRARPARRRHFQLSLGDEAAFDSRRLSHRRICSALDGRRVLAPHRFLGRPRQ